MSDIVNVTDQTFHREVILSTTPVIVDFWASWCSPCRSITPHLEAIARELGDKVKIVKVNIDDNDVHFRRFRGQSIPLLLAFRDGREVARRSGSDTKAELKAFVEKAIG